MAERISDSAWEKMRPVIANLYVTENCTLKQISEMMFKEHGFKATERQYKSKISRWDLRKNRRPSEKGAPSSLSGNGVDRLLACPFYQQDPTAFRQTRNHIKFRSCFGPGWPSIHRLREHLSRAHETDIHEASAAGIWGRLNGDDEEQRWIELYRILFPNSTSETPSAFYDNSTPLVGQERQGKVPESLGPAVDDLLTYLEDVLPDYLLEIVGGSVTLPNITGNVNVPIDVWYQVIRTSLSKVAADWGQAQLSRESLTRRNKSQSNYAQRALPGIESMMDVTDLSDGNLLATPGLRLALEDGTSANHTTDGLDIPVANRYPADLSCPFTFLDCSATFSDIVAFKTHVLTHFRPHPAPKRAKCFLCDEEFKGHGEDQGAMAWNRMLDHLCYEHYICGEGTGQIKPDPELINWMCERSMVSIENVERCEFQYSGR